MVTQTLTQSCLLPKINPNSSPNMSQFNPNFIPKSRAGMDLQISPYKETGTGVLKGVDDLNMVLDEQVGQSRAENVLVTY
jgi:hypothetical protein